MHKPVESLATDVSTGQDFAMDPEIRKFLLGAYTDLLYIESH